MNIFYHGTSKENWEKIKKEGVLWGGWNWHRTKGKEGYRHTYLTPEIDVARAYGEIILEVQYNPVGSGKGKDNYGFNPPKGQTCWQFAVFVPIDIKYVKIKDSQ